MDFLTSNMKERQTSHWHKLHIGLEKLKELFTSEKLLPKIIVTTRELHEMNDIEVISLEISHNF